MRLKMLNTNLTVENEPVKKKQRFASLETDELEVLLDSAQSQSTKYNTSFAVSVYKGKLTKECALQDAWFEYGNFVVYKIYGKFKRYFSRMGPAQKC